MKLNILLLTFLFSFQAFGATQRWSAQSARQWYRQAGWVVGANYVPVDAINQLEMWQAETFNPARIDWEFAQAESMGMTTMRVFLHDLVWQQDATGFISRIDTFLTIASRHHIKPVFVFFDSCWNPAPHVGPQPAPMPGVHNSGWVQSPGIAVVMDANQTPRLKAYVEGIIGAFAHDSRVLAWDLWNEPDNFNGEGLNNKPAATAAVLRILPQVFQWARAMNPDQPLTSAVWAGQWSKDSTLKPIEKIQLGLSDIVSFHSYAPKAELEGHIKGLRRFKRPIFCTEYMARSQRSTIQESLPLLKKYNVGAFNWGFVAGKTQTYFPWDSWQHPYAEPPKIWFHDLLYADGRPFDQDEINVIQKLTRHH